MSGFLILPLIFFHLESFFTQEEKKLIGGFVSKSQSSIFQITTKLPLEQHVKKIYSTLHGRKPSRNGVCTVLLFLSAFYF